MFRVVIRRHNRIRTLIILSSWETIYSERAKTATDVRMDLSAWNTRATKDLIIATVVLQQVTSLVFFVSSRPTTTADSLKRSLRLGFAPIKELAWFLQMQTSHNGPAIVPMTTKERYVTFYSLI